MSTLLNALLKFGVVFVKKKIIIKTTFAGQQVIMLDRHKTENSFASMTAARSSQSF